VEVLGVSILRRDTYAGGTLQQGIELERVAGAVQYRRFDSGGLVETRAATAPESALYTDWEAKDLVTTNEQTLRTKAQTALADNAAFLAIATPTAAQNAAQAKALTRQMNAVIRILLNQLADISDT
jgi:hypothetical protein